MMDVGPLQSNVVEHRGEPWIDWSPDEIVLLVREVFEPEVKENAILFERCSRQHMNGAWKVLLVFHSSLRLSPKWPLCGLPRLKEVDLMGIGAAVWAYC